GVFEQEIEPGAGPATGMALGGGLYLSPAEVHQMRIVPQLVFLNCCYLGQMRSDKPKRFHRIAANLAAAFIDNGVRCVVAAGWEVDDAAAKCFAEAFYREMIAGQTFAAAVLEARRRTYFEHPRVNTWGAYQCYGDPDFRLRLSQAVADPTSRDEKFGSVEELCVALETLTAQASAGSADNRDRLLERVALLKRGCNETWLRTHARLSEAFGRAFAVCEDFDSAIESYRDGMRAAQGDATLAMLEQLVNVSARQAARNAIRMKRGSAYDVEAVRKQILDSMDELAAFTRKYPTRERWSLMGSALRRLALVEAVQGDLSDMRAQIAASVAHYERANRLPGGLDPYAAFGAALGQLIDKWQDRTALDDVDRRLADIAAVLDPKGPRRDFWTSVYFADLALLRTLHAFATGRKTLPAELSADAVAAAYEAAMRRGANWQQRRSVQETFDFIALTLQRSGERRRGKPAEQMRAAVQLVQTIAKRLGFAPVQQAQGQASEQPAR
ncbi:MAG: CHAT domain-containing protein, partial [Betaproteobacteria bacterium]